MQDLNCRDAEENGYVYRSFTLTDDDDFDFDECRARMKAEGWQLIEQLVMRRLVPGKFENGKAVREPGPFSWAVFCRKL